MRAIEQLAQAIARIVGLRQKDAQQALEEVQKAKDSLPLVPGMLERTPPALLARLVPSAELREKLAELYELESQLHKQQGNVKAALKALQSCAALRAAAD